MKKFFEVNEKLSFPSNSSNILSQQREDLLGIVVYGNFDPRKKLLLLQYFYTENFQKDKKWRKSAADL